MKKYSAKGLSKFAQFRSKAMAYFAKTQLD